ncbi:hypothetical protein ACHAXT_001500 [Thalassiosira profunda]
MPTAHLLLLLVASGLVATQAFVPPAASGGCGALTTRLTPLLSTAEATRHLPAQSSLDKLDVVKLALKRPRGASVGVEHAPANELSDGDLSILSMQLRKSKAGAIWTADAEAAVKIAEEQESARGDFPGPVPVIYSGSDFESVLNGGGEAGAAAVVLEYGQEGVDMQLLEDVGIIWKVENVAQLQELADSEKKTGGVYLLSKEMLPESVDEESNELKEVLSSLPKSVVTIAPLPSMLPENSEVALGKHYAASLGISSLLLEGACAGDEEDTKYTAFAIDGISKKASSSFSMTGLTGSTNGHFGVSSHSGEVKWRRHE